MRQGERIGNMEMKLNRFHGGWALFVGLVTGGGALGALLISIIMSGAKQ
jgi:hypothetical protein